MKLKSLIMFSAAALAFAACSNDEDFKGNNGGVEGLANVSVKISEPTLSRAIEAGDFTTTTQVTLNSIKLVLTSQTVTPPTTVTFTIGDEGIENRADLLQAVEDYEFVGVRNPSKMEVFINTDKASGWTAEEFMSADLAEPLYAYSTTFTDKGDVDGDKVKEYEVLLNPEHTMARLEFGGIAHVDTEGKECMFATINIDGVILDEVNGVDQVEKWDATNLMAAPIGEAFTEYSEDTKTPVWPVNGQCYAYNIAGGQRPILKVCFSNITINTTKPEYAGVIWGNADKLGYATVKNYKLDATYAGNADAIKAFGVTNATDSDAADYMVINNFPNGYIYQVNSLEIPDEAIGDSWEGAEDYHVYAIVTVKAYTIVSGSVEWN